MAAYVAHWPIDIKPPGRDFCLDPELREKNLPLVVDNPCFLILPWVETPDRGSRILAIVRRRQAIEPVTEDGMAGDDGDGAVPGPTAIPAAICRTQALRRPEHWYREWRYALSASAFARGAQHDRP